MTKRLLLFLTILPILLLVGCGLSPEVESITSTAQQETTTEIQPLTHLPAPDLAVRFQELLKKDASPQALGEFIAIGASEMDEDLITHALLAWITSLSGGLTEEIDLYYSEPMVDIHSQLSTVAINQQAQLKSNYTLLSSERDIILSGMDNNDFKTALNSTFNKGYGLMIGEGTYYPTIDFVTMNQLYGGQVSPFLADYLTLMATQQLHPLTTEGYLSVSPEELGIRAQNYEGYLKQYPDAPNREEVRILLMVCIWKLVSPSPDDGMLTEAFTLSPALATTYDELLKHPESPVVYESVQGIMAFADAKQGILGSDSDRDAMTDYGYVLHDQANTLIKKLYGLE